MAIFWAAGKPLTSVSISCTRLPAVLRNPQTMLPSSCAACVSLSAPSDVTSAEKEPPVGVGKEVVGLVVLFAERAGLMAAICPLVFITAPEVRSSMIQAFTPGFFDNRWRASDIVSAVVAAGFNRHEISYTHS